MSVVRPELGPTLAQLLGPRVRRLSPARRATLAAAAAAVAAVAVVVVLRLTADERTDVVVRGPVAYRVAYPPALRRVPPRPPETLRLQARPRAGARPLAIAPLPLPAYRGDASALLTGMSGVLVREMRARVPGFVWRGDGRVTINRQPGYEILFEERVAGRRTYGRRTLLVPAGEARPRAGVDLVVTAARSPAVPRPEAVGGAGTPALRTALRSFGFAAGRR